VTVDPSWQPPWHVTVTDPWVAPPTVERPRALRPRADATAAGLAAVFTALLGPVAGLVWTAVAPRVDVARAVAGEETAFKAEIGADVWFLAVAVIAGVVAGLVAVTVFRARGPGLLVGLVVGGLGAAFAADRVGYLTDHASTLAALHAAGFARPSRLGVSILDFKVRALGVVAGWPIASIVVVTVAEFVDSRRR
jgi:hypothetical protein